jgi:Fe-S-cluster containining protein
MGRGLPQEVIGKAKQEVSLDDRFCFECKRCGHCCFRCEIVLTPYDILGLCRGVRMTTGEFLDYYGQITLGLESGLPVCWLDFEKVQRWRGGDERSPPCPFLALEGERFACGVYPDRPSCCRSFPVFRMGKADEEPKFYLQEVDCPAAETDRGYTVAQWIAHEGLAPYHRENDRFLTQVMTLTQAREAWSEEFLQLLAGLWYDYSRAREGEALGEKYEQAMRGAARLVDAVIELWRR